MSETVYKYFIYSTLQDEPSVGVWKVGEGRYESSTQTVQLRADLVEWFAPRDILGGGRTTLGVYHYPHTVERDGEVLANKDDWSREWFLLPTNDPHVFLVSTTPNPDGFVWTAGEQQQPITIQPFTGEPNQLFKFVRVDGA